MLHPVRIGLNAQNHSQFIERPAKYYFFSICDQINVGFITKALAYRCR